MSELIIYIGIDLAKNAVLITVNLKHFPVKSFVMSPADFIKEWYNEQRYNG